MIIKIFNISTKEMWTIPNKQELYRFIKVETGITPSQNLTIFKLMEYLPKSNYYRVK